MEYLLRNSYKMAQMYLNKPRCRHLIDQFAQSFFTVIARENFDPRRVKFEVTSPVGEIDKIVVLLMEGPILREPFHEAPELPSSPSYQLVRNIQSMYSAFLAENSHVRGWVDCCPSFGEVLVAIANYLVEFLPTEADLKDAHFEWSDRKTDLVCFIKIKGGKRLV